MNKAQSNVASPAPQIPVGHPARALTDALQAIAQLLQVTRPAEHSHMLHFTWLVGIVFCGGVLRFWGLGTVGLHGDEETMAMAAKHILVDGWSYLPSGMFYPRGQIQLYLMAASIALFGESEWALRLPSALCGVVLVAIAYPVGRRFLRPSWSLAFAATIAFLPALIEFSQTARMYIFLVALVMASMLCLFEWERTGRNGWLIAAMVALILGLDMQVLAVAVVLMFLMPGLVRGSTGRLMLGAATALTVIFAFFLIEGWVQTHYPTPPAEFAQTFGSRPPRQSLALRDFDFAFDLALWAAGVAIAVLAWRIGRLTRSLPASVSVAGLLFLGIVAQLALFYHVAAILYIVGLVLALRYGSARTTRALAVFIAAVAGLALFHAILLAPDAGTFVRLVGALVGQPSAWPYVRAAQLSPVAGLLTCALLAWGLYRLSRHRLVDDSWLLAVLGVWMPLLALGAFAWNVPPRYTAMSLVPLLLCALAAAQHASDWLLARATFARIRKPVATLLPAAVAICVINPVALADTVNSGYRTHPDHKGAAEFLRTLQITDEDVVLAEDVLQQTYYLGGVDYWLIGPQVASKFVMRSDDGVVDFYTATPVIVTPAMLDELLRKNRDKRVFVIGTGEGWSAGKRGVREELHEAIESSRFETLYVGRDGLTRVLQAIPGEDAASPATTVKSKADEASLAEDAKPAPETRSQDSDATPGKTE